MATMVGQVLNERYEILEKIGEGGMAVAYRGRDRVLGRVVAIKVMRPELATDAQFLARFRREARAAAGITHEHIAGVYDTGSDAALHYIVMEYVEGESLRDRLRREGPLPLAEALRITTETAEALEAAHQAGVVHRDIKPANILLGWDGRVKVTDFGIARAASAPSQTETSALLGSVHYVSPEQARGETVGPQGDIYSLGATLYETLTGKPPFNGGDRLAILHKHVYDRAPRPGEHRPGLPPEVDSLLGHCLEKDLSRRFASAKELLGYLAACPRQEDEEAVARARAGVKRVLAGGVAGAASWMKRRGMWVLVAVVVVLGGGIGGVARYAIAKGRSQMVRAPDVVGMSGMAARQMVERLGLQYREVGSRPSEDIQEGGVLSQDPAPGVDVAHATVMKVVVSGGIRHVVVPDVTQMSVAQAQRNLEAAGLASGTVQEAYSDKVPIGYVASTLPASGARVVKGTAVDMVVSLGRERAGPVGPALPPAGGGDAREETLTYVVPAEAAKQGTVSVVVELVDESGRRKLYEGRHRAGEHIPPQKIVVKSATTARILVDSKLRAERQYLP